jgi:hypothetical protein
MSDAPSTEALIDSLCPYLDGKVTDALEEHARRLERALRKCAAVLSGDTTKQALIEALQSAKDALVAPEMNWKDQAGSSSEITNKAAHE